MHPPQMILFDFGHTLVYEPICDYNANAQTTLSLAKENPNGVTPDQLQSLTKKLFDDYAAVCRPFDIEIPGYSLYALAYDILGLKFDLPLSEIERLCFSAREVLYPMEGIGSFLLYLKNHGIRTGVVSNISVSQSALAARINEVIPENTFEFVIASSEYSYRKPSNLIFRAALGRAGLSPDDVWFCGDDIIADVEGAHSSGLYPIWYESPLKCTYKTPVKPAPDCPHTHIHSWSELQAMLASM